MEFNKMGLPTYVINGLNSQNITNLTEIQNVCIPKILQGCDLVGQSQTGSGKTFAYGIPAICSINEQLLKPQVLIICPTRELAVQVCNELKNITKNSSIKTVPVFGGSDMTRQIVALKKCHIVVGTPGRLMDHLRRRTLKLANLKMLVLDEADEMLNMGFKEDIETILKDVPKTKQMIMFSATMPKPILELTKNYMNNPEFIKVNNGADNQSFVEQFFVYVGRNQKYEAILHLIKTQKPKTLIIFCNTKKMVDNLCEFLKQNNVEAVCMHGDKRQSERKRILDGIKKKGEGILIGTDVLARGIDISNVDAVYNFDMPQNSEYYIHRIGRTARAGKQGKSITIINTKKQMDDLKNLEKATRNKIVAIKIDAQFEGIKKVESNNNFSKSAKENKPYLNKANNNGEKLNNKKRNEGYNYKNKQTTNKNKKFDKFNKNLKNESFDKRNNLDDKQKRNSQNKKSVASNKFNDNAKKFDTKSKDGNQNLMQKSKFAHKTHKKDNRKFEDGDKDFFNGASTKQPNKKRSRNFKQFLK